METTRITLTLDLEHRPEIDLPARVAAVVVDALGSAQGIGAVEVVCGEMGDLMWIPHGARALGVEQLVASERRVSEAQRSRAEAAEAARADAQAAREAAERRADDAALEVRNLRGRVQAVEAARAEAERARDRAAQGPRGPQEAAAS